MASELDIRLNGKTEQLEVARQQEVKQAEGDDVQVFIACITSHMSSPLRHVRSKRIG